MADPVFIPTLASLKQKLRLTGAATGTDSEAVLAEATIQIRVSIFDALGDSLVTTINATAYVEAATSTAQVKRLKAALVELWGIKARLLRDAPTFFMDAKNVSEEAWNDENTLTGAGDDDSLWRYYDTKFRQGLEELQDSTTSGENITIAAIAPTSAKIIGQTILTGKGLGGLYPE